MIDHSYIFSSDHLEHLLDQIAELVPRDPVVSVLVDLVQDVVDLLAGRVVHSDLFGDLHQDLLKLAALEEATAVDVHLSKGLLHHLLHRLGVLHQVLDFLLAGHSIQIRFNYIRTLC